MNALTKDQTTRVDEIRGRVEKATDGPWGPYGGIGFHETSPLIGSIGHTEALARVFDEAEYLHSNWRDNRDFIAHSRQDIPFLLELVAELEKQRRALGASLIETNEYARGLEHQLGVRSRD